MPNIHVERFLSESYRWVDLEKEMATVAFCGQKIQVFKRIRQIER